LKLKRDKFERCLADKKQVDEVVRDTRYGSSLGIRGTPAFFIGRVEGEKIVDVSLVIGAQPYPVFARAIDQALQRAQ
jgi:protein-disulfide isomerase